MHIDKIRTNKALIPNSPTGPAPRCGDRQPGTVPQDREDAWLVLGASNFRPFLAAHALFLPACKHGTPDLPWFIPCGKPASRNTGREWGRGEREEGTGSSSDRRGDVLLAVTGTSANQQLFVQVEE